MDSRRNPSSQRNQPQEEEEEDDQLHDEEQNGSQNQEADQDERDQGEGEDGEEGEEEQDEQGEEEQNSRNSRQQSANSQNNRNYMSQRSEEQHSFVDPQQLFHIREVVGKLSSTEALLNSLKNEVQAKGTRVENKQKEVKDLSEALLEQIRQNPISRKPGLDQDIHHGIETAMVEAGASIQRLKKENTELKEIIKTKNQYIENIQENYRNMKKAFELKSKEIEALKAQLEEQNYELTQFKRKVDNDYKVNAMRENIRAAKNNDQVYVQKNENHADGIKDDYDFWKTNNDSNDFEMEREKRVNNNNNNKLENMFQGKTKLFVQDKPTQKDINFDNLKLSPQQKR